jgi:hypothetical protein
VLFLVSDIQHRSRRQTRQQRQSQHPNGDSDVHLPHR